MSTDPLGLKDFQRKTVDYVCERLFSESGTGRFLVADEVGLGKTLVARGVVAEAVKRLTGKVERIDVVYICSNSDIAKQNVGKLSLNREDVAEATRLTLLPRLARKLRANPSKVNFVSFTPRTTFDVADGLGRGSERALIYLLLRDAWSLGDRAAPKHVLRGNKHSDNFEQSIANMDREADPDESIVDAFVEEIREADSRREPGTTGLRERFERLMASYPTVRSDPGPDVARERARVVGALRGLLARSCVNLLEPDLVILDEFQRFSHVLDGDDEAAELARALFDYRDKDTQQKARTLLLSATPYRMYTTGGEVHGEDHHRDFVRTVAFLEGGKADHLEAQLAAYRSALQRADEPGGIDRVGNAREVLEARLRTVMVRTERLASTPDRNGMLSEVVSRTPAPGPADVRAYVALDKLAKELHCDDPMELWKSAPFTLSFMPADDYQLARRFEAREKELYGDAATLLLDWARIQGREELGISHPRVRELLDATVGNGVHELLWLPPSLPYYALSERFARQAQFTKRLIFSSWRFVPRAIAALVSYEAERQLMRGTDYDKERKALLNFRRDGAGRLAGMPVLALQYPCVFLAERCDPLELGAELRRKGLDQPTLEDIKALAKARVEEGLAKLSRDDGAAEDKRWYWAAPFLLDEAVEPSNRTWLGRWPREVWDADDESGEDSWAEHVNEAIDVAKRAGDDLGRRPRDLADVLVEMALGAPSVLALGALRRTARGASTMALRKHAAYVGMVFRSLFNRPEVIELLGDAEPYWRQVLRYCAEGCLASVLDEYLHVLRDQSGANDPDQLLEDMSNGLGEALTLRTASQKVRAREVGEGSARLRCHFALRFGDDRTSDDDKQGNRKEAVRRAFNSPFWPFVLASTSVGQEGLDFHPYCHALVHWNLPSNPVDLEQREGRVHRYKNHAVRKNVAAAHGKAAFGASSADPWASMFEEAKSARPEGQTDVLPFWVFSTENGARIERHVPAMPLSRETLRIHALRRSLAVYRMVFGQPRQDDLVEHLLRSLPEDRREEVMARAQIDLSAR